jgi:hypothetical protein
MGGFWQKFLAGLKLTLLLVLAIHIVLFIILNISAVVDTRLSLIYKSFDRPNFLLVMLLTSVISIFGWWLFRTSYKTVRQINESRTRARTVKLERDMADMKAKAAMLQTRPGSTSPEGVTVKVDNLGDGTT